MKALSIEKKIKEAAQKVEFHITFSAGVTESLDSYNASHKGLDVSANGPTKEKAIANARIQAEAMLYKNPQIIDKLK